MASSYASRLREALAIETPQQSIDAVKTVVREGLLGLDRRAKLITTEHFTHSYAPDFVFQWNDSGKRRERFVFLRFQSNRRYLVEDVTHVGDLHPIVFGLGDVLEPADPQQLREVAQESDALVTDAEGVAEIVEGRDESPFVSVVSSALAQGGRGLLASDTAPAAKADLIEGYRGAQEIDPEKASKGVQAVHSLLQRDLAASLISFLRAVWIGRGGEPETFPSVSTVSQAVTDEALQLLLDADEISDARFWWEVAPSVTLDQLGRVTVEGFVPNLQHLIRGIHPLLLARACRVVPDQPRLTEKLPDIYWVIERRLLALRGRDFTAYLSETQDALVNPGDKLPDVRLERLKKRADEYRVAVGEFKLRREDRTVSYASEATPDVLHDREVDVLSGALGASAFVENAEARLSDGRPMWLDFKTLTARSRTVAQFPIRQLVRSALTLLWDVSAEDAAEIDKMLPPESALGQETLQL